MKIISVRGTKNVLISLLAINIIAMQYYIPPFRVEKSFELEQPLEESKGFSRKLSKRKNNPNLKPKRYTFKG